MKRTDGDRSQDTGQLQRGLHTDWEEDSQEPSRMLEIFIAIWVVVVLVSTNVEICPGIHLELVPFMHSPTAQGYF